jgi:hypothetical protein
MDVPDGFSEFEPQGPFLQHIGPIQSREIVRARAVFVVAG